VNILETAMRLKQYQRLRRQGQIYYDNPVPQGFQFVNMAAMPETSSPTGMPSDRECKEAINPIIEKVLTLG
jgi:hypothetical protein